MLSLRDCIAMADIPEDKLQELAQREHLPLMLAVALAAQRGGRLAAPVPENRRRNARRKKGGNTPAAHANRPGPAADQPPDR